MSGSHDLSLPVWGPYNKKFVGFSHLADEQKGLRFDVDVFPGFYRRSIMQTKSIADGGAKLWQSRPDLTHFIIRYELNERVYCDMHLSQQGETARARLEFVNDSDLPQSLQANLCASIRLPTFNQRVILASDVHLPEGTWINAQEYASVTGAPAIAQDGFRRLEVIQENAVHGFAVSTEGMLPGGALTYRLPRASDHVTLRCIARNGARIRLNGQEIALPAGADWLLQEIALPSPADELILEPLGGALVLDGLCADASLTPDCFVPRPRVYVPEITRGERSMRLVYPELNRAYFLSWDTDDFFLRTLIGAHDDAILSDFIHNHVLDTLCGEGEGRYTDLFLRPIFLDPHTKKEINLLISADGRAPAAFDEPTLFSFRPNEPGRTYQLSQQLLSAAVQMNVVWPQYFRGSYIKHNTPGKVWDSFYTWDSGMIALGLVSIDERRAMECLNTYLMPENDPHSPYLQHGTPLLTQIFAFKELLDLGRTDLCRALYPGLRQGYRHLVSLPEQDTAKTGLIRTWHIFYNSGGWDDYPPQKAVHMRRLAASAAPVISTSFAILTAKILSLAAMALGMEADIPAYEADISRLRDALQHAWDEETGYYGYLLHDENGHPAGLLRDENGVQLNMGLDGAYPFIAGEGSAHQRERMLENITLGMMTPIGVSVVDTRAPYISHSGYWNGSVWMPHQWILWKALLGAGQHDLANRIARTALKVWKAEADVSHNCYEHFMLSNGRGAGFHHFSGLSSPVLNWFSVYHVPGHAAVGYETRIVSQTWNEDFTEAVISTDGAATSLIVTLAGGHDYIFEQNGAPIGAEYLHDGSYALQLPAGPACLRIRSR